MEFPYGHILASIPPDIAPPDEWPEFGLIENPPTFCAREYVGSAPRGIRWSLWPLTLEEYVGDREPDLQESAQGALARNRFMMWKRIRKSEVPERWKPSRFPWRIDGYNTLEAEYGKTWNHNARRAVSAWKERFEGKAYRIEEISETEFAAAYRKSTVGRKVGGILLDSFLRKLVLPERKGATSLFGMRNTKNGTIVAGTGVLFSDSFRSSVRECPFMLREARNIFAGEALIDRWFYESLKRGMKYLFFTSFWHEGEPRSWKGFSEFKSHFGLSYIAYPPLLTRFVRGKMF